MFASPGRRPRGVAFAPAVRGYPGGITDMTGDPDEPATDQPFGDGEPWAVTADAGTGAAPGQAGDAPDQVPPEPAEPVSVWQQSAGAWREAGIDWLRPASAGAAPAGTRTRPASTLPADDDPHTEPIPVITSPAAPGPAARANGVAAGAAAASAVAASAASPAPVDAAAASPAGADGAGPDVAAVGAGDVTAGERAVRGSGLAGPAGAPGIAAAPDVTMTPVRSPRGRRLALVAIAVVVVLALTLAGIGIAHSGGTGPATPSRRGFTLVTPYPPVAAADADFARQAAGAAPLLPSLTGIAAAGRTVVAIGAQPSQPAPVPLMLLSTDGGHTWVRATVAAPAAAGPAVPPPGAAPGTGLATGPGQATGPGAAAGPGTTSLAAVPAMVARGGSTWLALGAHAAWTSPDGRVWQPGPGLPEAPGDQVLGLAGTGTGFVAVGAHTGSQPGPVVWTSADGRAWQRESGSALGVTARGGQVTGLRWAAARGGVIVAGGQVTTARGRRPTAGLWRSADGGRTWDQVTLPAAHGATGGLIGLAANGITFLVVRPGRTGRHLDAVTYTSAQGLRWRYAGKLAPRRRTSMRVTAVGGTGYGFAVTAATRAGQLSFVRARGRGWHQAADPGSGVAGITTGPGGGMVVAGNGQQSPGAAGIRPHLLLTGTAGRQQVGQSVLTAAATPDTTVNALATAGRVQVAAGAAGGTPALWLGSPGGQWAPADVLLPVSWRSGALLSVAHGGAGWLTVGQAGARAPDQPVVLTSASGTSWTPVSGGSLTAPGTSLAAAAAGPAGYAVVGSAPADGGAVPAAWFSADLSTWARAPLSGTGSGGQMLAVTAARSGFVAVGAQGSTPAVWASSGGPAWRFRALPRPAGAASAVLTRVTAAGRRVVALGYEYRGAPAGAGVPFAAVSTDGGRTWRESVLPGPASPAAVTALTGAGHGFVAVGHPASPGQPGLLTWWSADGLTWRYAGPAGGGLPGPFVTQLNAVTGANGTLTGAGFAASGSAEHPVLWHARYR